ncbi:hypothetical protein KSB_42620 [Ktedonobacter robiniae]|uniref:Transposase DDE domain-containing protein n=1 Tax=Ktedonobacter robiniae TaxID=2778365 RepID=A0ABQ3UT66_9CHLR|nr:hypothetical protein KSB_42620 [Ktedonobacter robiniae]
MTIELAGIRVKMLLLTPFSFSQEFPQQFIKLIKRLVCEILRQFKEVCPQQGVTPFCLEPQKWLRLIFATLTGQLAY